jgi:Domain of unknown function (DUF4336)
VLHLLAENLWHAQCTFTANGVPISSRMTVARLPGSRLWLHSPIPIDRSLRRDIEALGTVRYVVAPCKMHHLFVADCAAAFPQAELFGAPGLRAKRRDLATMQELPPAASAPWHPDLEHLQIDGIPIGNETVWFHRPSETLIVTDLVQWWQGDLAWPSACYAWLTGVRRRLAVPRTVRAFVRDREALRLSTDRMLAWPFSRIVMAHSAVIETDARAQLVQALEVWK